MSGDLSVSLESPAYAAPLASRSGPWWPVCVRVLRWLLIALAAWFFLWPVYRAFLNVEIDTNEGWNAYFADAAMGSMPLYPSADRLITNNYPPVSFYIVGGLGKILGDPILAGRLLSLAAVLVIGGAGRGGDPDIGRRSRERGGRRGGICRHDLPFLRALRRDGQTRSCSPRPSWPLVLWDSCAPWGKQRSCLAPILLMLFAGFLKHNIIAMPLTAFLWLGFHRPLEAVKCAVAAGVAIALGFTLCFALYGRDFFMNMLFSRQYSWVRSFGSAGDLKALSIAMSASALLGIFCWRDRGVRFSLLFVAAALGAFFLQRTGAGVDDNALFDLIIAVSVSAGLAFFHAARAPQWPGMNAGALQAALLAALCARLLFAKHHDGDRSFRLLFDPSFKTEIGIREEAMATTIAKVRTTPGAIMSSNFACYRSGKPFAIDRFNATQRIATGALPPDAIKSKIAIGQLTFVDYNTCESWDNPLHPAKAPSGKN